MIVLRSVTKSFSRSGLRQTVLNEVNGVFEARSNYVVLGQRGAGKTTLLRLLSDLQTPTRGRIIRYGTVSLPLGSGISPGQSTFRELAAQVAGLYNVPPREIVKFAAHFSGMGDFFDIPCVAVRGEFRQRFLYALGYAIPVDFYLFDGRATTGDAEYKARCQQAFERRRREAGTIFVTSNPGLARMHGDRGVILHQGKLLFFDSLQDALNVYMELNPGTRVEPRPDADAGPYGAGLLHAEPLTIARSLIKQGEIDVARGYLNRYIHGGDDKAAAHLMLAEMALKSGQLEQAADASRAALEQGADRAGPHLMLARIAMHQGELDEAIAHATDALQAEPEHRQAAVLLAKSYESAGMNREAAIIYRNLWERVRNFVFLRLAIRCDTRVENWDGIIRSVEMVGSGSSQAAFLLDQQLRALIKLGRLDDISEVFATMAGMNLGKAIRTAYLFTKAEDWPVVIKLVPVLQKHDLRPHRSYRMLTLLVILLDRKARASWSEGRVEEARQYFQLVRCVDPTRPIPKHLLQPGPHAPAVSTAALTSLAALERARNREDQHRLLTKVAMYASEALPLEPGDRRDTALLAKSYESAGMNGEAAIIWRHLGEMQHNALFLRLAIRCDTKAENWDGILGTIEAAGPLAGQNDFLLDQHLKALTKLGRLDDAHKVFVALARKNLRKAILTAYLFAKAEDWPVVVKLVPALQKHDLREHRSYRMLTLLVILLDRRGRASLSEGRIDDAKHYFQLVHALDPSRPIPKHLRQSRKRAPAAGSAMIGA